MQGSSKALFVCGYILAVVVVAAESLHHLSNQQWRPATATWYGEPNGDGSAGRNTDGRTGPNAHGRTGPNAHGSTGSACAYGSMVDVKPYRARVGAVSLVLFMNGEGCGACYKVKCLDSGNCSRRAVTVIITDMCPGGVCSGGRTHFDLSGAAFSRMAITGEDSQRRDRGLVPVIYRRYAGKNVAFHVNEGSTDYWLSLLVEYEGGEGDIGSMHIRQAGSTEWLEMTHLWGANWCIRGGPLRGPFSVKLTSFSL